MGIFMNTLLNIRPVTYHFFLNVCLFVRPKTSGCGYVAWSWHKPSRAKSKLTRSDAITVQLSYDNSSAPVSTVEVKNIKSAGCPFFIQLQGNCSNAWMIISLM